MLLDDISFWYLCWNPYSIENKKLFVYLENKHQLPPGSLRAACYSYLF